MPFGQYLATMLGKELKHARLQQKMTLEELAHRANLDRSYISDLERDKKSPLTNGFNKERSLIILNAVV